MAEKKRKSTRSAPVKEATPPEDKSAKEQTHDADAAEVSLGDELKFVEDDGEELEFVEDDAIVDETRSADGVYDIDDTDAEISAGAEEEDLSHKVGKKEVLARLLEKNELILKLTKEKTLQERQLKELNDKWLRSVAEFENYRKRSRKEWELLKQQAKAEVILDILHVVDDFERAFAVADGTDSDEFVQGIKLIYNNLTHILDRTGVKEVVALHEPFDPNFHMAVGQTDATDAESGIVVEVVQKGYLLDDTVIRPANVIVAK